jgi:type II secretory pathway pseudopilin PulG
MQAIKKKSILENLMVLVLVGLLAGAAGAGAVGYITGRSTSSSSAPTK